MKFKMAPNSLFAVLMRNPWWYSFLLAGGVSLIAAALLPQQFKIFGVLGTFPFWVTGLVALKRQWNAPSQAAIAAEVTRLSGLNWTDFSAELADKFAKQGFEVARLHDKAAKGAADFRLSKNGQVTLVAAKRYKAAAHGLEPLQALVALKSEQGAEHVMYVCFGALSEQAQKYANTHGVKVGL